MKAFLGEFWVPYWEEKLESAIWKLPFYAFRFELLIPFGALAYFSLVCETAASWSLVSEENCWTLPNH